MASSPANVPLSENFSSPTWGRYQLPNPYTTSSIMGREPQANYTFGLSTLNHIDIRPFNGSGNPLNTPENWTATGGTPTFGPNATYNNWRMMSLPVTNREIVTMTSVAEAIDLTAIGMTGIVQAALPSAPLSMSQSSLSFSSDGFNETIATVAFNTADSTHLNGGILWIPLVNWEQKGVDLTNVNGVRLTFVASANGTVVMSGLRVIDPNYQTSSIAFDTWNNVLRQDIPLNGQVSGVPVPANQQMPPTYYAASTGGTDDPQPINATFAILFNTGTNSNANSIQMNMRQVGGTDTTQDLLDGQSQLALDGPQPGLTDTAEIPHYMSDLQGLTMGQLQGETMLDLQATAESVSETYLVFQIAWGSNQLITVTDSLNISPYTWTYPELSSNTTYMAICQLEDNSARVQIYNVNQTTLAQGSLVFDTGLITDSYQFIRRPGRIGWQASLLDGEAYVISIRPQSTVFAEYQSSPLNSRTPVQGAQIYANFSPDLQLWTGFTAATESPSGTVPSPTVTPDAKRTISGSSTKVYVTKATANQGIISNVLSPDDISGVTDWSETKIAFSVWFPSSAAPGGEVPLTAYLVSEDGWYVPLGFPAIQYDTWQKATFEGPDILSGLYQLQIVYTGSAPTTFWVDEVSVTQRLLDWSARANPTDPWVPFNGLVNDNANGVSLNRGTQLQVRAQAKRQDAAIFAKPKIKPVFAQLGKAVWPEDTSTVSDPYLAQLSASFSSTLVSGRTYRFTCPLSGTSAPWVSQWIWQFSDGTVITGPTAQHTFAAAGSYQVTLTVMDDFGSRAVNTEIMAIS